MTEHLADLLSAYADDELDAADRARVERHLPACAGCARELEGLRLVRARARALPDREPAPATADRLWAGIAAAARFPAPVAAPAPPPTPPPAAPAADAGAGPDVIPLAPRRRRTVTLSIAQLAAAGIALMLLSGGLAWRVLERRPAERAVASGDVPAAAAPRTAAAEGRAVAPVDLATPRYASAVAELERVLRDNRGRLDPATVGAIEAGLATIDRAIAQAREALRADPGNAYLNDHLAATMARKLELLRDAAHVVGGKS